MRKGALRQIINLAQKEFLQVRRDRLLLIALIAGPVLQFFLLGQTASRDIHHLPMAVVDQDKSSLSRLLITTLDNTQELELRYYLADPEEMAQLVAEGKARIGVTIPTDFAATIERGQTAIVQVIADGANFLEGSTSIRAAEGAIAAFVERAILSAKTKATGGIDLRSNVQFNPALNVRLYTIPAQLAFIVFQISLLVAALSFARERELGTLEQLQITPLHRAELILGKAVLSMAVGLVNFLILFLVSVLAFQVPMRGSFGELLFLTLVFLTANVALGMILSIFSANQQQALLLVFLMAVLQVNVSGYLVSVQNMPGALRFAAEFSPMRHYLTIIREVMLKGATLEVLGWHAVALLLLTVAFGLIAWGLLQRHWE